MKSDPTRMPDLHPQDPIMRAFEFEHLPPNLQVISRMIHDVAWAMIEQVPRSPERTVGLRKLVEAKDCFVRAVALGI